MHLGVGQVSKVKFDLHSHSLKQLVSDTMFLAISQYVFIEMCCILSGTIFKGSKVFWLFQEFCLLCIFLFQYGKSPMSFSFVG